MKDEGPYLREWIEYHRMIGVEKFILYNNESSDDTDTILRPYVDAGIVTLYHTDMEACQVPCYYNALRLSRGRSRWVAFIDLDEFIVPVGVNDFRLLLQVYEKAAALAVNWLVFGTGGHPVRPHGLQIENFITRAEVDEPEHNRHIKSIVDPTKALTPISPHHFYYREGVAIDEEGRAVQGPYGTHSVKHCRIHHYVTRSRAEWLDKVERGYSSVPKDHPSYRRTEEFFNSLDRNEVVDLTMQRFCPELNRRVGNDHIRLITGPEEPRDEGHRLRLETQRRHWALADEFAGVPFTGVPDPGALESGRNGDGPEGISKGPDGLVCERRNGRLTGWESWNPLTPVFGRTLSEWGEVSLIEHLQSLGARQIEREYCEDGTKRVGFPEAVIDLYLDRTQTPISLARTLFPDTLRNTA